MMPIPATIFIVLVSSLATTHAWRLGEMFRVQIFDAPVVGFSLNASIKPLSEKRRVIVQLVDEAFVYSHLDIDLKKQIVLIPVDMVIRKWSRQPSYYDVVSRQYEPRPFPFTVGKKFTVEIVASSLHTWEFITRGDNWEHVFSHYTIFPIDAVKAVMFYGDIDLEVQDDFL